MTISPEPVPSRSLAALEYVRAGGVLVVPTHPECTAIDAKVLRTYELQRPPLLEEAGDGYRMRTARGSVVLEPGELRFL